METRLYMRVIDTTDNGQYDYGRDMSNEEWAALSLQQMYSDSQRINPWAQNVEWYQNAMAQARTRQEQEWIAQKYGYLLDMGGNQYGNGLVQDYRQREAIYDDTYEQGRELSCKCLVTDSDEEEIGKDFFDNNGGQAFLMCVNPVFDIKDEADIKIKKHGYIESGERLNENGDIEAELRMWLHDSDNIINEETYDDDKKIRILPSRILEFSIGNEFYMVPDCRILENRKEDNNPYKFVVLGNKIVKER